MKQNRYFCQNKIIFCICAYETKHTQDRNFKITHNSSIIILHLQELTIQDYFNPTVLYFRVSVKFSSYFTKIFEILSTKGTTLAGFTETYFQLEIGHNIQHMGIAPDEIIIIMFSGAKHCITSLGIYFENQCKW